MTYTLKSWIFALLHPSYWMQNNNYNAVWDEFLHSMIALHRFDFYESLGGVLANE